MDIIIDFDGTVVSHEFPLVGKDIGAVPVLKKLVAKKHRLILFTMRSNLGVGKYKGANLLDQAVQWFADRDIPLYGIQTNPTQSQWTESPKAYGQLIIDDTALGIPLNYVPTFTPKPFVDWEGVENLLMAKGLL